MVHIKKNKLIIEIKSSVPEELYCNLLKDIIVCVQATQADMDNDELKSSLHFLLELYKAMLPDETQVGKMFGNQQ